VLDWDHNAYYHRLLLRVIPTRCHRALDVGCGAGSFASRLAQHVEQVDAIDRSAMMIEIARNRNPDNVNRILADAMTHPLTEGYDAIFSICALHHMNLEATLPRFDREASLPSWPCRERICVTSFPRRLLRHLGIARWARCSRPPGRSGERIGLPKTRVTQRCPSCYLAICRPAKSPNGPPRR
jgi:SAM-dependent methyltransferase